MRLTVTKVVFESNRASAIAKVSMGLTVTKVVFESATKSTLFTVTPVINSNKGCF